jgi:hypothetical protein
LVKPQINERVNQRIEIGNRRAIADVWSFDTESICLAIDVFHSASLGASSVSAGELQHTIQTIDILQK